MTSRWSVDNPLLARSMAPSTAQRAARAAGSEGTSEPRYPAAYASVIGVGAVDAGGAPFARGNIGPSAELLAPGVEVLSTVPGDAFAFGDGTSLAAAHVSGARAAIGAVQALPRRAPLFRQASQASEGSDVVWLPSLCDVFERLGKTCSKP
jgi:hypothetical protein